VQGDPDQRARTTDPRAHERAQHDQRGRPETEEQQKIDRGEDADQRRLQQEQQRIQPAGRHCGLAADHEHRADQDG
jgi:hypothetical protein